MSKSNSVFKDAYNRCLAMLAEKGSLPSEPQIAARLKVSRTTVRAVLQSLVERGLIDWSQRSKTALRPPRSVDYFPGSETQALSKIIEQRFMHRVLTRGARAGDQVSEVELARDVGVSTSAVREFLIRFSRFGLIEKHPNSHWVLKGFNRAFALELTDVREMFELRAAQAFAQLPQDHPLWQDLAQIEAEHRAMREELDTRFPEFSELDGRFHRVVLAATDNRFMIDFFDVFTLIFHYHYQWNKVHDKERNLGALNEHLDYMTALQSRDMLKTELYCKIHLRSARETLLGSIDAMDSP